MAKGLNIAQLRILLLPINRNQMIEDNIKIYANANASKPSIAQHQFESVPLWQGGQGIIISKEQLKADVVSILVVGYSNFEYTLLCTIIDVEKPILSFNTNYIDMAPKSSTKIYQINFSQHIKQSEQIVLAIKISTYSGEAIVGLYEDDICTRQFQTAPFKIIGNSKYIISSKELKQKNINSLFVRLQTGNSLVSLNIFYTIESITDGLQLTQGQYLFRSVNNRTLMFFSFERWSDPSYAQPNNFSLVTHHINNQVLPLVFKTCDGILIECLSQAGYPQHTTPIKSVTVITMNETTIYSVSINSTKYKQMTDNKKGYIIIGIQPKNENNFISVYFNDLNIIRQIAEVKSVEKVIPQSSANYYLYSNNNTDVKTVIFHLSSINGQGLLYGYLVDPRRDNTTGMLAKDGTLMLFDNLNKPIYIQVVAKTHLYYSLNVISSEQKLMKDGKNRQIGKFDQSKVVFFEANKDYLLTVRPGNSQVIKIVQKSTELWFRYKATSKIGFCQVYNPTKLCLEQFPQIGNKLQIPLKNVPYQPLYLRIINLSENKTIEVTANYIADDEILDKDKQICLQKEIGIERSEVIRNYYCFIFHLYKVTNLNAMFTRTEMIPMFVTVQICDSFIDNPNSVSFTISKQEIQKQCRNKISKYMKVHLTSPQPNDTHIRVQYIIEYYDDILYLPLGIGHTERVIGKYGILKKYYFKMHNKVDTEVRLHSQVGKINAYLKLVDQNKVNDTEITSQSYDLSSSQISYFQEDQVIAVTQQMINKIKCYKCLLIIVVYANIKHIGQQIEYMIEVVQGSQQLSDHLQKNVFLAKGNVAYFEYQCKESQKTVIFDIQDNNRRCSRLYTGKLQFPSESNNEETSVENTITSKCESKMKFLSVEAIQDCPISVSARSSHLQLNKISTGNLKSIQLEANKVGYYVFNHDSDTSFKLYTLQESGISKIYLNQLNQTIMKLLQNNTLDVKDFSISNDYKNSIEVTPKSKGYCSFCSYIVGVKADTTLLEAIIMLVENNQKIPMVPNRVISDELVTGGKTQLQYFDVLKATIYLNLFQSTIHIKIKYQEMVIQKHISNKSLEVIQYDFSQLNADYNWSPIQIIITNNSTQLALYSLSLSKDNSTDTKAQLIKEGIPIYLTSEMSCAKGYLSKQKSKIYFSVDQKQQQSIQKLEFSLKVDNKQIAFNKNIVSNTAQISYFTNSTDRVPYVFCVLGMANIKKWGIVLQASHLNLLPVNVWTMVNRESSWVIHPGRMVLLDVFTCEGQVDYKFSYNYYSLMSNPSETNKLDATFDEQINTQLQKNHAIYYDLFSDVMFVRLVTNSCMVRWMNVDKNSEVGVGYLKYKTGKISWTTSANSIIIRWETLKNTSKTLTTIVTTKYRLLASRDFKSVKSWAYCEMIASQPIYQIAIQGMSANSTFIQIDKQQLSQRLENDSQKDIQQYVYFMVVADTQICINTSNNQSIQNQSYVFIYNPLVIPINVLNLTQSSNKIYYILITISIGVLSLGCLIVIVVKKLVPMINRLKGGDIELEQDKQQEQVHQPKISQQQLSRQPKV